MGQSALLFFSASANLLGFGTEIAIAYRSGKF
jgi:hypothetical protein